MQIVRLLILLLQYFCWLLTSLVDVLKWDRIVAYRIFDFAVYTSLRIKCEVLFALYFALYTWLDFALSQFRTL